MNDILSAATDGAIASATAKRDSVAQRRAPSRFFLGMSCLLLVLVLAGFSPTLYLRAWTDVPRIPVHVMIHGIVMTAWFVLLAVQTTLVAVRRTDVHRKLGVMAAGVGVLVGVMSVMTNLGFAARIAARSHELPQAALAGVSSLIWANFALLLAFAAFLAAAIVFRTRADVHKRLMLLASVSLIAPALARIARWPIFEGEQGPFVPLALLALLAVLPAYDLISSRRLHPATLIGTVSFVLIAFGTRAFGMSPLGRSLLRVFL